MNIVCIGLNHKTAPVELRENFAVAESELHAALARFKEIERVEEVVILSTCNRVEFYGAGAGLHSAHAGFDEFLTESAGVECGGLEAVYRHDGEAAVRHLFQVACGLDSMVLGETEILGQVKKAYGSASGSGFTARVLNKLFQRAFQAAKQVRTHTAINRGAISVGSVAVDLAGKIFGNLAESSVMVLGAGETGERTARSFLSRGVSRLLVCNRSAEKASALASELGGEAVDFNAWEFEISRLDILITCSAAPEPLLRYDSLYRRMATREEHPLFVIDLAVPRNVHTDVNQIESVYLYDIDSLQAIADRSRSLRSAEMERCCRILDKHTDDYLAWLSAHGATMSRGNHMMGERVKSSK